MKSIFHRHHHEWKEEFREFLYDSQFGGELKYKTLIGQDLWGTRPVTVIHYICECKKRREERLYGHRKKDE